MSSADPRWLFVGCYTHGSTTGIHTFAVTETDGMLTPRSSVDFVEHASFLAAHPSGRTLYAVSESSPRGSVVALRLDPRDESLVEIDRVPSHGSAPCHVSVDAEGRHAYIANYESGTVAAYSLDSNGRFDRLVARSQHEGSGPHPRQDSPHAHCVIPDPRDSAFYAVDLGIDTIHHYTHGNVSNGVEPRLSDITTLPPGSGPRHLTFHPQHPIAFVVGELDSTLICLDVDPATGALHPRETHSTLPDVVEVESIAADVHVHPDGRTVYVSNRGHDSIAAFSVGERGDEVTPLGHVPSGGRTPRNFAIHPSGASLLVANQDSNTIVAIDIDATTGTLSGGEIVAEIDEPVCLIFVERRR